MTTLLILSFISNRKEIRMDGSVPLGVVEHQNVPRTLCAFEFRSPKHEHFSLGLHIFARAGARPGNNCCAPLPLSFAPWAKLLRHKKLLKSRA